jgi:hypothetical protein
MSRSLTSLEEGKLSAGSPGERMRDCSLVTGQVAGRVLSGAGRCWCILCHMQCEGCSLLQN